MFCMSLTILFIWGSTPTHRKLISKGNCLGSQAPRSSQQLPLHESEKCERRRSIRYFQSIFNCSLLGSTCLDTYNLRHVDYVLLSFGDFTGLFKVTSDVITQSRKKLYHSVFQRREMKWEANLNENLLKYVCFQICKCNGFLISMPETANIRTHSSRKPWPWSRRRRTQI